MTYDIKTITGQRPQNHNEMGKKKNRSKNNRKQTAGRYIQFAPAYTSDEVATAPTAIEASRRSRCLRNIQHHP